MKVFKNCRLFDPHTDEILNNVTFSVTTGNSESCDNGRVFEIYYDGETPDFATSPVEEIDLNNQIVIPSFIDAHMHCESTLLPPSHTSCIAQCGTAVCIADPHEIVNVLGKEGFELFLEDAEHAIVDFKFAIPSCVPATPFETAGGNVTPDMVAELLESDRVRSMDIEKRAKFYVNAKRIAGLAEVMNVPGVLDPNFEKLQGILHESRASQIHIDGHAPGIPLPWLNRYIAAGITTDHECTTPGELKDRVRRGMNVLIREGTVCHNAKDLCSALVTLPKMATKRCAFCTDDRRVEDILSEGHIDNAVRIGIQCGIDPKDAIRMATLNPAEMFNLTCDYGSIAPGKYASFIVLKGDLKELAIDRVFIKGTQFEKPSQDPPVRRLNRMNVDLAVFHEALEKAVFKGPAIGIIPNQVITVEEEPNEKSLMVVVVERYTGASRMGHCLVNGIPLGKECAVASTVSHDSHNVVCVGSSKKAIELAVKTIVENGGGYVCVNNEKVTVLPLPIAGLLTDQPVDELLVSVRQFHEALNEAGADEKFDVMMTLSALCLPVIPKLRLTDMGLFDVDKFQFVADRKV